MSERVDCQWMAKYREIGRYNDEPCNICKGYVSNKGKFMCPFQTQTYELFQSTQHLVTADERLYSIQAGVRADKHR